MCIKSHSLFGFDLQWNLMLVIILRKCEGNSKIHETYEIKWSKILSFIKNAKNIYYIPDIKFLFYILSSPISSVSTTNPQMEEVNNIKPVCNVEA